MLLTLQTIWEVGKLFLFFTAIESRKLGEFSEKNIFEIIFWKKSLFPNLFFEEILYFEKILKIFYFFLTFLKKNFFIILEK